MAPFGLTTFLALSTASTVVTTLAIGGSSIASHSVPQCSTLGSNSEGELCSPLKGYLKSTSSYDFLERRQSGNAAANLPEWSEPVHGGWLGGNMTRFCIRDGPKPKTDDVKKLCGNIDDNYIIARTKQKKPDQKEGDCFCKKFHQGTAWFNVCNCDSCDRLEILSGLKEMCRETNELCASNGFSSGFVQLDEKNGLLVQYNVKPEDAKSVRAAPDPMKARPNLTKSTCISNDEYKKNQDYTGPVVECWRSWKAMWMAHKCHDNSKDGPKVRSGDYWKNKWMRNNSELLHSVFGK
jgi:hypothetical protein